VCVNPLSWRSNQQHIAASENPGSITLTATISASAPDVGVTGARCENGILWIDAPTRDGYDLALFPGGSYHAYDYNLFYMSIRANVAQRVQAFLDSAQ
jgi:hypothetical protein